MGRGKLTQEEIEELRRNPYVVSVDSARIKYSDDFKKLFMCKYLNGERPGNIFRNAGFDTTVLGSKRVERACSRWRAMYCSGALDIDIPGAGADGDTRHMTDKRRDPGADGRFEAAEHIKLLRGLIRKQEHVIKRQRAELEEMKKRASGKL